ncbi:MAG: LytTR family DNA-binding domain-containing protein, partial [Bacilli bacterium]
SAHTIDNAYQVKYKLYELEEILTNNFMRVSKSTIVNIDYIYSIERNITSSSIVEFQNTHKKVYVSRYYYWTVKSSF